ncbi:MAG: hypothetical protein JST90_02235 [Bacteroidetes bacterium]|nr:hypothetical protein [Bacteroidota bacterium]
MIVRRVIGLVLFLFAGFAAKCDTIDFWHVYLNGKMILDCREGSGCHLTLNKNTLKSSDTLIVVYFNDSGCQACVNPILADSIHDKYIPLTLEKLGMGEVMVSIPTVTLLSLEPGDKYIYYKPRIESFSFATLPIIILHLFYP